MEKDIKEVVKRINDRLNNDVALLTPFEKVLVNYAVEIALKYAEEKGK